ncbi:MULTISPECIES: hypothetical protein [Pseudoalteromonas]|uniref:hypothetical protein n=1 Tax=Pseudoalteromonas TaxID=53246 RepID=UPI00155724CE|nr:MULTISPECIES: hypothetical protein [Pseudoalteromonas]QQQ64804.1 hypothetical protein JJQ94_04145 [Pseudoalteromonas sp. GCY]WMO15887.1 hypothetical protein NI376_21860 [Pseudoalteromonas piscicida]
MKPHSRHEKTKLNIQQCKHVFGGVGGGGDVGGDPQAVYKKVTETVTFPTVQWDKKCNI